MFEIAFYFHHHHYHYHFVIVLLLSSNEFAEPIILTSQYIVWKCVPAPKPINFLSLHFVTNRWANSIPLISKMYEFEIGILKKIQLKSIFITWTEPSRIVCRKLNFSDPSQFNSNLILTTMIYNFRIEYFIWMATTIVYASSLYLYC